MRKHLVTAAILAGCATATSSHAADLDANTTVGGLAFLDLTNISDHQGQTNGTNPSVAPSGTGFDVKRFYLVVDHQFNDIFSADLTADAQYASNTTVVTGTTITCAIGKPVITNGTATCPGTGNSITGVTPATTSLNTGGSATDVIIKFLYLTAKINDAFIVHAGSYNTPWIQYTDGITGYRWVEKGIADRLSLSDSSADWGLNVSGAFADNLLSYSASVTNGGGYKNPTRTKYPDFEGRITSKPLDWLDVGLGYYNGHLGQVTVANETYPSRNATRWDGLVSVHFAGFRVTGEYIDAKNFKTVNSLAAGVFGTQDVVASSPTAVLNSDLAKGYSFLASYAFNASWNVFARYDDINPSDKVLPNLKDRFYDAGIDFKPIKALDLALVYKNEQVHGGAVTIGSADANGSYVIGGATSTTSGTFREIGIYAQYKF
ncbi:MAG TPA: hypothetical protein VMC02_10925 [Steroidobacteraceae bacterium]|nr:hypothetical protein [Steroidobacteraceae bacterium]